MQIICLVFQYQCDIRSDVILMQNHLKTVPASLSARQASYSIQTSSPFLRLQQEGTRPSNPVAPELEFPYLSRQCAVLSIKPSKFNPVSPPFNIPHSIEFMNNRRLDSKITLIVTQGTRWIFQVRLWTKLNYNTTIHRELVKC